MSESVLSRGVTRRTFLKATAATAAVAAMGNKLFGGSLSTLVESAAAAPPAVAEDVWVPTICDLCDANCGLLVHRVNGVVVKVEGNPDHPENQGKICGRPNCYPMTLYNPYRPKAPLKRTNPDRGLGVDPKWVEISWDEALNTVTERLKRVLEDDPNKFWRHRGHRGGDTALLDFAGAFRTVNKLGSVNFCTGGALHFLSYYMTGADVASPDMKYCDYTIEVGGRFLGAKGTPEDNRVYSQAKDRGLKVADVCPIISPNCPNPDEWIPIRPGGDAAFWLAMCNVMVNELGTYDVEFLKNLTNAPYLIGPDGLYVRAEEPKVADLMRRNEEVGPPLVWDPVGNKAKPFNDPTIKDFALEGTYRVNGVECQPAFQLLKDHIERYTPEYAEEVSDVPAETTRRLARELVEAAQIGSTMVLEDVEIAYRPANVGYSKALSGSRGYHHHFANRLVNMLIGNIQRPGGLVAEPELEPNPADGLPNIQPAVAQRTHPFYWNDEWNVFPPETWMIHELYPVVYNTNTLAWLALENPEKYWKKKEDMPEVYGFVGANILANSFNPGFIAEQMKKIPFIFGIVYHLDDVAEMCDIVFPEVCHLERLEFYGDFIMQPVVEPIYDSKNGNDICIELADRTGMLYGEKGLNARYGRRLGKYKLDLDRKYTWEEITDRRFKRAHGEEYGLEWFREHGYRKPKIELKEHYYEATERPQPRYNMYLEYMVWVRERYREFLEENGIELRPSNQFVLDYYRPLPDHISKAYEDLPPEYDLYCVHYKTMLHSMATFMDNPWIEEHTRRYDPYSMNIMINPEAARQRGIKNGDLIWVESPFGKTSGEAAVTKLTRPDTVAISGLFGATSPHLPPETREGPIFNALCWADEYWRDPLTGNQENTMKVKVYKT
ncbi:MAG: molybdopterin-dependent oxidoreductase [Anaerolineae bacterium]|nr:molybdopterin-dependent oxidoreductase [Anaerolineae bacterium]